MVGIFYQFINNFLKVFSLKNLPWHFLAFTLTFLLIASGADWSYFLFWHSSSFEYLLFPAVILGFLVPVFVPIILILTGYLKKNIKALNSGYAIIQASGLGWFLSVCYKAVTGRPGPPGFLSSVKISDISHIFHFGFLKGGVFWGWPSSHTTTAFAVGITIFVMYSENKFIKYLALVYGIYIGFGVSTNIHWLSDAVAGAIFGSLVGVSVGTSFRKKLLRV